MQAKQKRLDVTSINVNSMSIRSSASCGYCNGKKSTKLWVTSGFHCTKMRPEDYQLLMNRGWRRCGVFYYQPHLFESCCQAYTIRLDTYRYRLRQSHLKVMRKIINIELQKSNEQLGIIQEMPGFECDNLETNVMIKQIEKSIKLPPEYLPMLQDLRLGQCNQYLLKYISFPTQFAQIKIVGIEASQKIYQALKGNIEVFINLIEGYKLEEKGIIYLKQLILEDCIRQRVQQFLGQAESQFLVYENKSSCLASNLVAKFYSSIREFQLSIGKIRLPLQMNGKFLLFVQEIIESSLKGTNLKGYLGTGNQIIFEDQQIQIYKQVKLAVFKVLQDLQRSNSVPKQKKPYKKWVKYQPVVKHNQKDKKQCPIVVKWCNAVFEEESFNLYCRYQDGIHGKKKDQCSKQSYQSFLCQAALEDNEIVAENGSVLQCGCKHMKYYLDNTLIAIGVIDILPQSLSSVYFFYDPDYKKYSLGVYGALKEIEYINTMQKSFPYFQYYYLGFYIQDSQKMVYKGDYYYSDLLCPITYQWVPLDNKIRQQIKLVNEVMKDQGTITKELMQLGTEQESLTNDDQEQFIKENVKLQSYARIIVFTFQISLGSFSLFLGEIQQEVFYLVMRKEDKQFEKWNDQF